ncbi:hypothetical protein D7319_09355 [Streptomyces radicis]|uniref:Metallophosphoesterase n=1 Tax=Streptomyces radicis TaxID=1750517 RepID=A0A3A9WC94_9ACTN|nr:hypothetical protein D7319_09355 [Streptomyces radicis]RKN24875.1 hypothetical protein D7318_10535 [Streptomyces radicis]
MRDLGPHPLLNHLVPREVVEAREVEVRDGHPGGGRDRSRACVLLAHQPAVVHEAADHGVDPRLSGHTHGGQLWPGNLIAELANPTVAGLERHGDALLHVTRGAGAWGPPVRVDALPDVTVVTLSSVTQASGRAA